VTTDPFPGAVILSGGEEIFWSRSDFICLIGSFDDLDLDSSGSHSQGSTHSQRQTPSSLSGIKHGRSVDLEYPLPKHRDMRASPLRHSRSMTSFDSQSRQQSAARGVVTHMPPPAAFEDWSGVSSQVIKREREF
jgi:hypothetical protein